MINNEIGRDLRNAFTNIESIKQTADEAKVISTEAKTILENANEAIHGANAAATNAQQRLEDLSSVSAVQFHDRQNAFDVQLAQTARQREMELINMTKYGEIKLPSDFSHNLDFKLWRDVDGRVKHNFNYDKKTKTYSVFYVAENGTNTRDGLTPETSKRDLGLLLDEIEANSAITSAKIIITSPFYSRNRTIVSKVLNKNYSVEGLENCYLGTFATGLSYTLHSGNIYKTTRTSATEVFDVVNTDVYNMPSRLKQRTTLNECIANPGSWFTDGNEVFVHRIDGSASVHGEIFVCLSQNGWQVEFGSNSLFMAKNLTFLSGAANAPLYFHSRNTVKGNAILQNVKISSPRNFGSNGIGTQNIKSVWVFDSLAKDIARDGFNYHNYINKDTFAFEYNCLGINCGLEDGSGNNNISTAHDGMSILRIGTKGSNSDGPLCADVNGCYTIAIDCDFNDSVRPNGNTKAAFWFDDNPTAIDPNPNGKAILINCGGGGAGTFSINCGESFKANKIILDNFRGRNIPLDINFSVRQ